MHKKGFTLSETLIALAIVGIISVMVIPTTSRRVRNNIYASTENVENVVKPP